MKNYKIVSISDNHGLLDFKLPSGFILTISGDITPTNINHVVGQEFWIQNHFHPWCEKLIKDGIFEHIVYIAGNHDRYFSKLMKDNKTDEFRKTLPKNVHYLLNNMVEIDGIKIYGTPFTPTFGSWYFMHSEDILDNIFAKIPEGLDILLSHGPAYGWNDKIEQYPERCWEDDKHIGSKSLRKHILRAKPKMVCTGHIHSASHNINTLPIVNENLERVEIKTVNVSLLDEDYLIAYKPLEFNIVK